MDNVPENVTPVVDGPPAADSGNVQGQLTQQQSQPAPPVSRPPAAQIAEEPVGNSSTAVNPVHENWGDKVYHGVLSALGGSHDVALARDPQTGKMVATVTKSTPGTQWKRIISGALAGVANADANAGTGPGAKIRALGLGIQGGEKQAQQRSQQQRSQANEDFEAQQTAAYQNARTAMLNQQLTMSTFDLARRQVDAQFEDASRENQLVKMISDGGEGSVDLGVARNIGDVIALHKDMPDLVHQQAAGNIIGIPHVSAEGKIDGMHYALVTPEWKNQKLQTDQIFYKLQPPTKPGESPKVEPFTVKAGTLTNGDFWNARMSSEKEISDFYLTGAKLQEEHEKDVAAERNENAEAREHNATADVLEETGELPGRPSTAQQSEAYWGPGGDKGFNTWHNQVVKPAMDTETSYRLASNAYNEYKAYAAKGQKMPTGAQSMMMLSQHLGTTFGTVKGSRVTKDMIQEHLGARSVSDDLQVAVNKLINGDALSAKQWDAFGELISEKRNEQWNQVLQDAVSLGRPLDRIPFPADFRKAKGLGDGPSIDANGNIVRPAAPGQQPRPAQQQQPPAAGPGAGKQISLAQARLLPQFKGMNDQQITDAATKLHYTVTP